MKELGLFAAGVLFGTAGIKLLGSRDAPSCGRARMTSTQKPRPSTSAAQRRRPPLWWRTLPRRTLRRSEP